MSVYALSGAASFAACLRLFRCYPLAVTPSRPGSREDVVVLRHRAFGGTGFYVLTRDQDEHFTLRPWAPGEGEAQAIRPATAVPAVAHRVITEGMPVPRDGALLGWVSDHQASALLPVRHGDAASQAAGPQVRALAMAGSEPAQWPPFTLSPLDDGRLWEYVDRGEIVDLEPLLARASGGASWVPSQNPRRAGRGHGCVVVTRNLQAEDYWVPAGVYLDHWMLREGVPAPSAAHLLALPGATDLSRRLAS